MGHQVEARVSYPVLHVLLPVVAGDYCREVVDDVRDRLWHMVVVIGGSVRKRLRVNRHC